MPTLSTRLLLGAAVTMLTRHDWETPSSQRSLLSLSPSVTVTTSQSSSSAWLSVSHWLPLSVSSDDQCRRFSPLLDLPRGEAESEAASEEEFWGWEEYSQGLCLEGVMRNCCSLLMLGRVKKTSWLICSVFRSGAPPGCCFCWSRAQSSLLRTLLMLSWLWLW